MLCLQSSHCLLHILPCLLYNPLNCKKQNKTKLIHTQKPVLALKAMQNQTAGLIFSLHLQSTCTFLKILHSPNFTLDYKHHNPFFPSFTFLQVFITCMLFAEPHPKCCDAPGKRSLCSHCCRPKLSISASK